MTSEAEAGSDEKMPPILWNKVRKKLPQTQMIEFYGSSETSRLNNRRQSMDLTVEEKNEIEIRLVEIQTILENSLYEDSDEERELLREQNELEHMLEIQNYVR